MKTIYLIIGLMEDRILRSAYLTSSGINEDSKYMVVGILIDKTEDYLEAIKLAQSEANSKKWELGIEIKIVYTSIID